MPGTPIKMCKACCYEGAEVYTKDLSFLLQLLRTSKQSGLLFVEPPGQPESSWLGQFRLDNGVVMACLVRNRADGRVLLNNDEAIRWLTNQGKLVWHLEEEPASPEAARPLLPAPEEAQRAQPPAEAAMPPAVGKNQLRGIPHRTQKGRELPANSFASREHRQVFTLVDGRRSIEEIVYLLHKPPDFVIRVLHELQAAGFIA